MIYSRCAAGFPCFLSAQPVYALPLTVIDPTKRAFSYDLSGNLTEDLEVGTDEVTQYAYDLLNRLTEVSSLRAPAGGEAISLAAHVYDGEGKRISATEGGVTTTYLYDGLLPIVGIGTGYAGDTARRRDHLCFR